MLTVKILGSGCPNYRKLAEAAREAAWDANIEAEFIMVTDREVISRYEVLFIPALVIKEKVVCAGRIPTVAEVQAWMTD